MTVSDRLLAIVVAGLAVTCFARDAAARYAFAHPKKATRLQTGLVPAFVPCNGG